MRERQKKGRDTLDYGSRMTLEDAKQILGVDQLPGDEKDVRDFLVLTERLLKRNGKHWIYKNKEKILASWQFHLRG
jgi:hypothetical protein